VADTNGPVVAGSRNAALFRQKIFDQHDVAHALDEAVCVLRAQGVPLPRRTWFVHTDAKVQHALEIAMSIEWETHLRRV
jgi:hypothetical protein